METTHGGLGPAEDVGYRVRPLVTLGGLMGLVKVSNELGGAG